ncbi:MAG: DUF4097 family beta strand repeat-containing protein [Candidatus Fermentibacteraceae bacterium]
MRSGAILAAMLLSWAACSITMGDDLLEERTESYSIEQGGNLSIRNVNGNVSIEPWDGPVVEVTLAIRGNSEMGIPEGFEATAAATPSSLSYEVEYPRGPNIVSVSFIVRVPRELSLKADVELVNGSITAVGPHFVNLETSNGSITVEGAAGGDGAGTTNGNITASFIGFAGGMTLETVNGSIRATLPADAAFSAVTVNGNVTVEGFNTTTSSRTGVTVRGEPSAEIGTVNGNITVGVMQASASGR